MKERRPQRNSTQEERQAALAYAKEHGSQAAAKQFDRSTSLINYWIRREDVAKKKTGPANVSDERRAEIVAYAREHSVHAAAAKFHHSWSTVKAWMNGHATNTHAHKARPSGHVKDAIIYLEHAQVDIRRLISGGSKVPKWALLTMLALETLKEV